MESCQWTMNFYIYQNDEKNYEGFDVKPESIILGDSYFHEIMKLPEAPGNERWKANLM